MAPPGESQEGLGSWSLQRWKRHVGAHESESVSPAKVVAMQLGSLQTWTKAVGAQESEPVAPSGERQEGLGSWSLQRWKRHVGAHESESVSPEKAVATQLESLQTWTKAVDAQESEPVTPAPMAKAVATELARAVVV
jgi:hypothetical protein